MFDLESCICFINNRVSKKMADMFNERLAAFGVTRVQWIAMYYLLKYGVMSQKDLADRMDLKESTVARLVDRMESENLIERIKDASDRRVTNIELTKSGRKRIEELLPEGQKMSDFFSNGITDEEIEVFKRVLDKFMKNIS